MSPHAPHSAAQQNWSCWMLPTHQSLMAATFAVALALTTSNMAWLPVVAKMRTG